MQLNDTFSAWWYVFLIGIDLVFGNTYTQFNEKGTKRQYV